MQSNSKNKKIKIAAIVLAVVLCICTGSYVVYSYINSSKFNPDMSSATDVKINEIDLESETEKMNAEKPDKSNDATDLDERRKKDGANSNQNQNKKIFVTGQANKYLLNNNGNANNNVGNIGAGDIIGGIVNGNGQNGAGNSQNGNGSDNTSGGNSSNNNSGNNNPNIPADNNGDTNVIFPTLPAIVQPSKTIPKDQLEEMFGTRLPEYVPGDSDNNQSNLTLDVSIADTQFITDNYDIEIYSSEELSDYIILCRVWAYAKNGDTQVYRFRQVSDNFYIKDYPETAVDQTGNNEFYATFCFRQTSLSEWQYQTVAIPIVKTKLLLGSYEEGVYPNVQMKDAKYLYPQNGDIIDLLNFYNHIQGGYGAELTQLFRGWSETQNGVPIEDMYTVEKNGLIFLYPSGFMALPSQFKAKLTSKYINSNAEYWQTIYDYSGDGKSVDIPKYIQSVQFEDIEEIEELNLPYTTKNVSFTSSALESQRTLIVKKQYTVDENNKFLSTIDGALASEQVRKKWTIEKRTLLM